MASPWGWAVGSPRPVRPFSGPGHGQPVSLLHLSRRSRVHSFRPPSLTGQRQLSCPVSSRPQACDRCSVLFACLWLLSKQPRPFENTTTRSCTPSHLPCPQATAPPLTSLFPGAGAGQWHADGWRPKSPQRRDAESRTPGTVRSSFQIRCQHRIVFILWPATRYCPLMSDGKVDSRGRR